MYTNIPEPVFHAVIKTVSILNEDSFLDNENCSTESATEVLTEYFMKRFLGGLPMTFDTEEAVESEIQQIIAIDALKRLKSRGIVDSIEDEHGEMIHFLTAKGKEVAKELKND